MSRAAFALALVCALAAGSVVAHAAEPDAAALLSTLESRKATAEQRRDAAAALIGIGPGGIDALKQHLQRERKSSEAERRAVLAKINADVPDEKGRFVAPRRGEEPKDANLDWLATLLALDDDSRAYGELVSDVAVIRALAASDAFRAGTIILNFAFTDSGLIYRDECGRYLREMAPHSLPALVKGSNARQNDKRRYATYQLERMDRENPAKAMAYSPHDVRIGILGAYGETEDRRAVLTVLDYLDDVAPEVRAAARAAWMEYVTGPPPPEAPKKKLELAGGKLTEEEMPLWLTSRELADIYLRERIERVLGEKPAKKASLEELSKQLFDHYDTQRAARRDEALTAALGLVDSDPAAAAAAFDEILAADPLHPRRAEMAAGYHDHAQQLKTDKAWTEAAIAFGKAYGVEPEGEYARRSRAEQHYALGRARMASGKDPKVEFEQALELYPEHPGAQAALAGDDPDEADAAAEAGAPTWMFYAGIAGGVFAILLAIVALARRDHER